MVPETGALTVTSILTRAMSVQVMDKVRVTTLSVSIVATSSSASTVSPTCFDHDLRVPSEMDSAI